MKKIIFIFLVLLTHFSYAETDINQLPIITILPGSYIEVMQELVLDPNSGELKIGDRYGQDKSGNIYLKATCSLITKKISDEKRYIPPGKYEFKDFSGVEYSYEMYLSSSEFIRCTSPTKEAITIYMFERMMYEKKIDITVDVYNPYGNRL